MKKIIEGKKYDTETAKRVGRHATTENNGDFCIKELYKKKTGEFFFYTYQFAWCEYYEGIDPCTEDEAKQWAEVYLDGDEYEEIFGEVEE